MSAPCGAGDQLLSGGGDTTSGAPLVESRGLLASDSGLASASTGASGTTLTVFAYCLAG
jgi:hypothetical protein